MGVIIARTQTSLVIATINGELLPLAKIAVRRAESITAPNTRNKYAFKIIPPTRKPLEESKENTKKL